MADGGIKVLDGWRGCAILAVLVGHFLAPTGFNTGRLGVELFFVLSGRLMADVLFVRRAEIGPWALRRFARLVPALWFFVAVVVAAGAFRFSWGISPGEAIASAAFVSNYAYGGAMPDVLAHVWSLCVEVHCYIVMALVAWFGRGLPLRTIAAALLALAGLAMINGAIQSAVFGMPYYDVYWRSDTRGASILAAAGLFLLLKDVRSPWLFVLCVPAGVGLQIDVVPDAIKYTFGTTLLALGVCGAPHAPAVVQRVLSLPPLTWLGLTSYSLYLWQQVFKNLSFFHWSLALAAAVIWGALMYRVVEQPMRRLLVPERSRVRSAPVGL